MIKPLAGPWPCCQKKKPSGINRDESECSGAAGPARLCAKTENKTEVGNVRETLRDTQKIPDEVQDGLGCEQSLLVVVGFWGLRTQHRGEKHETQ